MAKTQSFEFNQVVKHGRFAFAPGPVYGFEDPDAAPYFNAMGWGDVSSKKPDVVIGIDDLDIDPATVFADGPHKGQRVMGG